jgi:hypothetical protein
MDSGFGYNDYGFPIDKKVDVGSQEQEVSFTVPETGEYGIYVRHIKDETTATPGADPEVTASDISDEDDNTALLRRLTDNEEKINSITNSEVQGTVAFTLEINKVFENPLVLSDNEGIPPSVAPAGTTETAPTASPQNGSTENGTDVAEPKQPSSTTNENNTDQELALASTDNGGETDDSSTFVFPVNKNGETYGSGAHGGKPDLIAAVGTEGQSGYIRERDEPGSHIIVNTPEDVAKYVEYMKTLPSVIMIPLYDQEGNVIGEFRTSNSYGEGNQPKHYDSLEEAREAVANGD